MYDVNSKFNNFYTQYVVLSNKEQQELYKKKNLNITRLKEGLKEYNTEKKTSYKIGDEVVQGSVAMSTITQNDEKDYDIDVAIIFDKCNIPDGTTATKNIVVNALKKKCTQFKIQPEFKTNCVRLKYNDGYHLDFAIYRRWKNEDGVFEYEHCGSQWRSRDPRSITNWFVDENKEKEDNLRKITRLLKMFCKSRSHWKMPGGLIQSVLINECFVQKDNLSSSFYYTIEAIKNRLEEESNVNNPIDESLSLILTDDDKTKITNLKTRLNNFLETLDILFSKECTYNKAINAWNNFFNHSYWSGLITESNTLKKSFTATESKELCLYDDTEEFIELKYPVNIINELKINCKVTQDGFRTQLLRRMLSAGAPLKKNKSLEFYIENTNAVEPYKIYWKVRNNGHIAQQRNCIRGQILADKGKKKRNERTNFNGPHTVDCYIIKNGICIAIDTIDVPISH